MKKPYATFVGSFAAVCRAANGVRCYVVGAEFERLTSGKWRVSLYR